jgi:hypothetical protein
MKRILMVLLWCGLFVPLSSYAQETATWNLARDLQISFTQGSDGVWYFMESEARVHDPSVYRILPRFLAPCQNPEGIFAGIGCWQGTEDILPNCFAGCGLKTEIAFNFTDKPIGVCDLDCQLEGNFDGAGYLPHTARVLATWQRFAIVAWQSPLTGFVKVSGQVTWRSPKVTAVDWFFDKGKETLRAGHVGCCNESRQLIRFSRVRVHKGDVLYFILDGLQPMQDGDGPGANPVDLKLVISQVP